MINLSLIAPPGGGKGTQSERLVSAYRIAHISTGDIFRAIVKGNYQGSFDTKEILDYMNKGLLIPDDIVVKVVMDRLGRDDCKKGFLLDGFPRTLNQAEAYDKMADAGRKLNTVILMNVDEEGLIKRLSGRRSCSKCGRIYNVYFSAPKKENLCDDDGAALVTRSDDNIETVKKRISVYKSEAQPLLDYYKKKGILYSVNGDASVDEVFKQITRLLPAGQ